MNLTNSEIYSHVDHTNLSVKLQKKDIDILIDEAILHKTASICIPSFMVSYANSRMLNMKCLEPVICTVVGFPNGNCVTDAKLIETTQALKAGAKEIDMVINISALKDGDYKYVTEEIKAIKEICKEYNALLKVIIETYYLSEAEIRTMCTICTIAEADYIKTSTGFAGGGATKEVVSIMHDEISNHNLPLLIKAAGGIKTKEDMIWYLEHGCSRLGTSSAVKILG